MNYAEILRHRDIRSVVWFHADHWEPWAAGINDRTLKQAEQFVHQASRSRFGKKMTLFYLAGRSYRLREKADPLFETEIIDVQSRSNQEDARARDLIGELRARTDVEFQLHLHHEHLVGNDGEWSEMHRELKPLTDPQKDERRLHFLIRTELETLRRDTSLPFERWAFVHGMWALNGSDRTVCKFDNEISILMQHGCWGDFSFPAGRYHCDPVILQQPYTCKPFTAAKSYDDPRCQPIAVDVGTLAFGDDRFLIWNSKARHLVCSLDYYNEENRRRVKNADHIVFSWLTECPVIDGVLYIKTHAHSMDVRYYEDGNSMPLAFADVEALFGMLQRSCDGAKVELKLATVDEVADALRRVCVENGRTNVIEASSAFNSGKFRDIRLDAFGAKTGDGSSGLVMVDRVAVAVMGDWLAGNEQRLRAAGEYYTTRLSRGHLFVEPELALVEYSRKTFNRRTRFVELGFGFGELSLLLSLSGFAVTGLEISDGRYEAGAALIEGLAGRGLDIGQLTLVRGAFPSAFSLDGLDGAGDAVLVATNVTSSHVKDNFDHILRALRVFDHVIIDITRFGIERRPGARDLLDELARGGFIEVARVYSIQDSPDIRHFSRTSVDEKALAALHAPTEDTFLRYSDVGSPVPRQLSAEPFHIFDELEIPAKQVLPRLAQAQSNWLPVEPIKVRAVAMQPGAPANAPPVLRVDPMTGVAKFTFAKFGSYAVESSLGVFKCLMLDPDADRDRRALDIFQFASANIVHSCVDKATILPWAKRTRYIRPDLMLAKLFLSDQPLALHCDHASQVTAYLLHLNGYLTRELWVLDPAINSGHVVMEVFLPGQGAWVMLDTDFGVVVTDRSGKLMSAGEIVACKSRDSELVVKKVVAKNWPQPEFNVCEAYGGQLSWTRELSKGTPAVDGDSYFRMMDRFFKELREGEYRFEHGFEDNRLDARKE